MITDKESKDILVQRPASWRSPVEKLDEIARAVQNEVAPLRCIAFGESDAADNS